MVNNQDARHWISFVLWKNVEFSFVYFLWTLEFVGIVYVRAVAILFLFKILRGWFARGRLKMIPLLGWTCWVPGSLTVNIILLPRAGMHFESEVYSMYKNRNQAPRRPVTLSANSSLWLMPAMIIFILARALQQNVNDDKLTESKPTLQAPHLRRSLSKSGGAFGVEQSISFKFIRPNYVWRVNWVHKSFF